MNAGNERAEQRKHRRFEVSTGSLVSFGVHSALGKITDMGVGGLAFRYIGEAHPNGSFLDISLPEHNFYLRSVRFKTVADFAIDSEMVHTIANGNLLHGRTLRRSSVHFEKLSPDQRSQLEYFLQNYTVAER
jgi:hypothetical protein